MEFFKLKIMALPRRWRDDCPDKWLFRY